MKDVKTVFWKDNSCYAVDQTLIPQEFKVGRLETVKDICEAIYKLGIRGAPAIGVAGAFAIVTAIREAGSKDIDKVLEHLEKESPVIGATRPTATNLKWAVDRMMDRARSLKDVSYDEFFQNLLDLAQTISDEEVESARVISEYGANLITEDGANIITHCHTGPFCTIKYGLSAGAAIMAHQQGKNVHVYTDETRPRLQGAKINTFEFKNYGVPFTLITDNMAAYAMKEGLIDMVFVSADRVAANGDTAAKIGVYGLCVLAQAHGIPVFMSSPMSTVDFSKKSGDDIVVEQRDPQEVLCINGAQIAPKDTPVLNPAFDVTPHNYLNAIITEVGVAYPPFSKSLKELKDIYDARKK